MTCPCAAASAVTLAGVVAVFAKVAVTGALAERRVRALQQAHSRTGDFVAIGKRDDGTDVLIPVAEIDRWVVVDGRTYPARVLKDERVMAGGIRGGVPVREVAA